MGNGYDEKLPSILPFMWVEEKRPIPKGGAVISYGAYNAFGLIGSEKGGVAIVSEDPPAVLATIDIPWDPPARAALVQQVCSATRDCEDRVAVVRAINGLASFQWRMDVYA